MNNDNVESNIGIVVSRRCILELQVAQIPLDGPCYANSEPKAADKARPESMAFSGGQDPLWLVAPKE